MRAAIYARMFTDKQSADSPADQIARCREFAGRREWHVVDALALASPRSRVCSNPHALARQWTGCERVRGAEPRGVTLFR